MLLTKPEMTQRQQHHHSLSRHEESWGQPTKGWEPGTHCTAYRQLNILAVSFPSDSARSLEVLPGSSVGFSFSLEAGLVSVVFAASFV